MATIQLQVGNNHIWRTVNAVIDPTQLFNHIHPDLAHTLQLEPQSFRPTHVGNLELIVADRRAALLAELNDTVESLVLGRQAMEHLGLAVDADRVTLTEVVFDI